MDCELAVPHSGLMGKQIIILAGATSVGKSAVAAELCNHMDAEIVLADSVQIYKHLDIGSNKPSKAEMDSVPHHLVNLRDPHETFSCGDFVRTAAPIIFDILDRGKVPVIVGGSTMWIQWLVHGMPDAPKANAEVIKRAEDMLKPFQEASDWEAAVAVVSEYDRVRVEKLGKNDWYRLHRYLEVALTVLGDGGSGASSSSSSGGQATKRSRTLPTAEADDGDSPMKGDDEDDDDSVGVLTGKRQMVLPGIDVRCFFLSEERSELYHYIDTRCETMLKAGLFEEVTRLLLNDALTPDSVAAKAIGYRQTIDYLCNPQWQPFDTKAFERYVKQFATATRNYAKRQLQWYRKDEAFLWLKIDRREGGPTDMAPYRAVCAEIAHWYAQPANSYRLAVRQQILRGLAVTAARNRKKAGHRPKLQRHPYDLLALQEVESPGGLAVPLIPSAVAGTVGGSGAVLVADCGASSSGNGSGSGSADGAEGVHTGSERGSESPTTSALAAAAEYTFTEAEQAAVRALIENKRGDVDLSTILPKTTWSAEEMSIRAAEGIKRSTVLISYQNRMKTDDIGKGSEFDDLIRLADECATELREKHPAIVQEFSESAAKVAVGVAANSANKKSKQLAFVANGGATVSGPGTDADADAIANANANANAGELLQKK